MNKKSTLSEYTYDELAVGQTASFSVEVTGDMVEKFAELSGDHSPIHVDPAYAKETEFGRPIAHGMIGGMLISRLVGMHLPGKYCLFLSLRMSFRHPVFIGTEIVVSGKVTTKGDAFKAVTVAVEIRDKIANTLLADGEALVRLLK